MDIHDKAQKIIQYGKSNGKTNDEILSAVNKLYTSNDAKKGVQKPQTQFGAIMSGIGEGTKKGDQFFKDSASGKPAFPATNKDVGASGGPQDIAKILGNTFSDAPAVLKGMVQLVTHPINSAKGIAEYYGGIASDAFNAVKESIKSGNMQAINAAVDNAEKSVIDHPLQAIMAYEGAKGAVEGGVDVVKDVNEKGVKQTAVDKGQQALEQGKQIAQKVHDSFKTAKNVLTGDTENPRFRSKSAIHQMTVKAASNLDDVLNAQKKVADLSAKVKSFADKTAKEAEANQKQLETKKGQVKETGIKIAEKSIEQRQAELELKTAQNELNDIQQKQKDIGNQAGTATQSEMSKNGFGSIPDLSKGVTDFFKAAKENLSKVYDDKLGNAKINLDKVFSGITKFQDYLRSISDTKTLKVIQPMIDNLKIRDIVAKAGDDNTALTRALSKSGVDPRMWHDLDFDRIRQDFPPLTSENIKGTRNNIEETIRQNNTDALKNFGTNVKDAFKDVFKDAIKDTYGQESVDKLNENDKNWSELMKNPLSSKENPTLADVQKNWKSFTDNAKQLPEGESLIQKIQNYTGEQILNAAESRGEYSAKKIESGIKKYSDIIGEDVKQKLNDVSDLVSQKTPEQVSKEQQITETKQKVDETKQQKEDLKSQKSTQLVEQKDLQDKQSKINADAKEIGADSSEIMKNIKSIDTIDSLNSFLEKSGKSIEDVRSVMAQSVIENVDKEAGRDPNAPFDVNRINQYINAMNKIGGDGPEGQAVNDEMLGEDGRKLINETKKGIDEYNRFKSMKSKTASARIIQGSFGALLMTIGMGRFFGARQIYEAFKPIGAGKFESLANPPGRERPTETPESSKGILGKGILGLFTKLMQKPLLVTGGTESNKKKD